MAGETTENQEPTSPFADFQTHEVDGAQVAATEGSQGVEANAKEPEDTGPEQVDADEGEVKDTGDGADTDTGDDVPGDNGDDTVGDDGGDGADDDKAGDGAGEDDKPKRKNKVSAKDRIAGLVKERSTAQRDAVAEKQRADDAVAELAALKAAPAAKAAVPEDTPGTAATNADGKPSVDDFTYGELDTEYQEALTNWMVDTKLAARETAADEIRQTEAAEVETQKIRDDYDKLVSAGIDAYGDFDEVVVKASDEGKYPMSEDTVMLIMGSDVGHHVIHKIATDLDFAKDLAQKTPLQQAVAIGRLEAQFTSSGDDTQETTTPKTTGAPTPPKTRQRGSGARQVDAKSMNFADFEKQHNKANG